MTNTITVPGPISGNPYQFVISGDRPSVDEQLRIDALLSQREQEFQTRYAEAFGAPVDTGESTGLLNYLGEIPDRVPKRVERLYQQPFLSLCHRVLAGIA